MDAPPVEVASLDPVSVSAPAVSRHDAHRPSGASGGSCRPHRGQRRDRWVTVSDITSPGSSVSPQRRLVRRLVHRSLGGGARSAEVEAAKADIWIRQNRRPGLRAQRLNEMTDLVVDVPPIRNGFRDALAQQGLEAASETMHRGFDRAFRRPEAGRHGGVAPSRRLSQQARFELVELGGASLSGPLRAKVGEQARRRPSMPSAARRAFREWRDPQARPRTGLQRSRAGPSASHRPASASVHVPTSWRGSASATPEGTRGIGLDPDVAPRSPAAR